MGYPACCGRFTGIACVLIGGVIFGLTGFAVPNTVAPQLLAYAVDSTIILTENDIEVQNKKWSAFVGGSTEIDVTTEYSYSDGGGSGNYYYLYNVTNAADFITGKSNPILQEVGPFGYKRTSRKYDIKFLDVDIVSYKLYSLTKRLPETACLTGQELLGHLNPTECLDPTATTVTILDPIWAQLLAKFPFESLIKEIGSSIVQNIMNSVIAQTRSNIGNSIYPELMIPIHNRYLATVAISQLKSAVEASSSSLYTTYNVQYSDKSPLEYVKRALNNTKDVFASNTTIMSFYNASSSFSPLSPIGFDVWYRSGYTPDIEKQLIDACAIDGTTQCDVRVRAIRQWLFSTNDNTSWVSKSETKTAAYHQFVSTLNSDFKCEGLESCNWNSAFAFSHVPPISVETYYKLFSSNNTSLLSLASSAIINNFTSWKRWEKVNSYCALRDTCPSGSSAVGLEIFEEMAQEVSLSESHNSDTIKDQTCSIAAFVSYHLYQNKVLESMAIKLYKSQVSEMDPSVASFSSFAEFAYLQFANSAVSKFIIGTDTLDKNLRPEFHLMMGHESSLSVADVGTIMEMMGNSGVIHAIFQRAYNSSSNNSYVPTQYKARLDGIDFSKTAAFPYSAFLNRLNADRTKTIASGIVDLLSNYVRDFTFKQNRLYCNDPVACDYSKGGMFITASAQDLLFDGAVNPASLHLANQLRADTNAVITCNKQKYYYTDRQTSGLMNETTNRQFLTINSTGCIKPVPDPDCTDGGILVETIRFNSSSGKNESISQFWTRDTDNATDLNRYYSIRNTSAFVINEESQQPISFVTFIYANDFGGMHPDLTYQRQKGCSNPSTCTSAHNTGFIDRNKINQVYFESAYSTKWPNKVKLEGSLGAQFPPRYMDGVLASDCPERRAIYSASSQGTIYYDLEELTSINYDGTNDQDTTVQVCRYVITPHSYNDSIIGLQNPTLMPPVGFMPIPPGAEATEPSVAALGQPNFLLEAKMNSLTESSKFSGLQEPTELSHGSFFEVEQATGVVIRRATRQASYFRIKRGHMYPHLKENYYLFPVSYATSGSASTPETTENLSSFLLLFKQMYKLLGTGGIVLGSAMIFVGVQLYRRSLRHVTVKRHF